MRVSVIGVVSVLVLFSSASARSQEGATGPSYDCRRASTPDEQAVCDSTELSVLDRLVSAAYKEFEPEFADKRDIARGVLADRHYCSGDTACIAAVYANALYTYGSTKAPRWPLSYAQAMMLRKAEEGAGSTGTEMPEHIGECARSTISSLTDRFGTPLANAEGDTGSAVDFSNGGHQVSYALETGLQLSEVGDRVTICLMETPRDCPDGDDRGRGYLTINEDQGVVWMLGDAQHVCGGA